MLIFKLHIIIGNNSYFAAYFNWAVLQKIKNGFKRIFLLLNIKRNAIRGKWDKTGDHNLVDE